MFVIFKKIMDAVRGRVILKVEEIILAWRLQQIYRGLEGRGADSHELWEMRENQALMGLEIRQGGGY